MAFKKILAFGFILLDIFLFIWLISLMTPLVFSKFFAMFMLFTIITGVILRLTGHMTIQQIEPKYKKNPKIKLSSIIGIIIIILLGIITTIFAKNMVIIIGSTTGIMLSLFYVFYGYDLLYNFLMMYESIDKIFKGN